MYTVGEDEEGVGVVMEVATGEGVLMTWRACWNFIGRYWGRYWRWILAVYGEYELCSWVFVMVFTVRMCVNNESWLCLYRDE